MSGPVLIADIGAATSKAVLIRGRAVVQLAEPLTGSPLWPTGTHSDALHGTPAQYRRRADPGGYAGWTGDYRRDVVLIGGMLKVLRDAGVRRLRGPVDQLVLVADPGAVADPGHAGVLLEIAEIVGFTEAELLARPQAVLAAAPDQAARLTLVLDFGARALTASVVRTGADGPVPLVHETDAGAGGRAFDRALAEHLRARGGHQLAEALRTDHLPPERAAVVERRLGLELADAVQRMKHTLAVADVAVDSVTAHGPALELRRDELPGLLGPIVDRALVTAGYLLQRHGDVERVLVTGGPARLPYLTRALTGLGSLPVTWADEPDLDSVNGAAKLVLDAPQRRAGPAPADGCTPLRWEVAGARLVRWLVEPGQSFPARAGLAVVRTADGALRRLRAPDAPGALVAQHAAVGALIAGGSWLATVSRFPAPRASARAESGAGFPEGIESHSGEAAPRRPVTSVRPVRLKRSGLEGRPEALAFSPDGRLLAATAKRSDVQVWDTETGRHRYSVDSGDAARSLAFTPDGERLLVGGSAQKVIVCNAANGRQLWTIDASGLVHGLAFSPAGAYLAIAAGGTTVLREWQTGENRWRNAEGTGAMAFSPDGRLLALATADGRILVREVATGTRVATLDEGGNRIGSLGFSPDSRLLVSDAMRAWNLRTGEQAWNRGGSPADHKVAFAPDGRLLVAARRSWYVVDLANGHTAGVFELEDGQPSAIAVSPDGTRAAVGFDGGAVIILRIGEPA